jgi:Kef-type K+ transport system membrane component KefB
VAGSQLTQITWVGLASVAGPLIALMLRRAAIPGVVVELILGVVLGPAVLGWVSPSGLLSEFSEFGLALLMFLAGLGIDLAGMRGRTLSLAARSWAGSAVGALVVIAVLLLAGHRHGEVEIALAMTTTALGTLLPVVRDAGVLRTPLGRHVLAVGTVGEFAPIVLIALLLGGKHPVLTAVLMLGFGLAAVGMIYTVRRPWGRAITETLSRGLHASSQLPVRIAMVLTVGLVFVASHLGLDVLVGAFAAGIVVRVAMDTRPGSVEMHEFEDKLEAIGFGVFIPVFFVVSGARLDLAALAHHPVALTGIPLFFAMVLLVRGLPTYLGYRSALPQRQRLSLALLSATGLPLIVVITTIGTQDGDLATQTAAALVTAGVLTVLILPATAVRLAAPDRALQLNSVNDRELL